MASLPGARAKDWKRVECPRTVLTELLLNGALLPSGSTDMTKSVLPVLGATDASTVYGLGATVSNLSPDELRIVARLSAKAGEHVTLSDGADICD